MVFRKGSEGVELLVSGLGNPGSHYAGTRHNVGYRVLEAVAHQAGAGKLKRAYHGRFAAVRIAGRPVGLLEPTTFMNTSGRSVAAGLEAFGLAPGHLLVVHDEIDLPFGRLQLRHDGGHGGHNGLRSLHELVGPEFDRLRVGVDRPPSTDPDIVADYVLSPFAEPRREVDELVAHAAEAVDAWVRDGLEAAMERIATLGA